MKIRKLVLAVISASVLTVGMTAVSYAEETAEAEDLVQIGEKASDEDYAVAITNETGKDISGIRISVDKEEYGDNLLDGSVLEDGARGMLYCTPKPLEAGATSAPRYDIEISYADDDRTSVIHTFPFGDCSDVSFLMKEVAEEEIEDYEVATEDAAEESTEAEDSASLIAYLKFVSLSRGSEQDTYEHEVYIVYPPAVDPYAYTPSASDYSYTDYSYSGGGDYSYDAPVYSEPVYDAPVMDAGGNDDDCMTDGLLN